MLALCAASYAQIGVGIAVSFGPPPLPIYEQPLCPGDGYLWTPGYWAYDYDDGDYYWVPGTWILAPAVGLLWTPGWWGWEGGGFIFHEGYWGPQVGFYGGINYGYGYFGEGYQGGRWDHDRFFYNRTVNNVNVTNIHNVYNTSVVNSNNVTRASYNGGNGGVTARPSAQDQAAERARHTPPVAAQTQQVQAARSNRQLRASVNQGKPPVAATQKPGDFNGQAVAAAKQAGGPYTPPPNRAAARPPTNTQAARPSTAVHPNDLPPIERPAAATGGNAEMNQKYSAATGAATRAAAAGTTEAATAAGAGAPANGTTKGQRGAAAADGTAAPATDGEIAAATCATAAAVGPAAATADRKLDSSRSAAIRPSLRNRLEVSVQAHRRELGAYPPTEKTRRDSLAPCVLSKL